VLYLIIELINYIRYIYISYTINKKQDHKLKCDSRTKHYLLNTINSKELIRWIEKTTKSKLVEIKRDNMLYWTSYFIYFEKYCKLNHKQRHNVKKTLNDIEYKINNKFAKGCSNINFFKFGLTPMNYSYRPLIIDFIFITLKNIIFYILECFNFHQYEYNGITYLYYNNNHKTTTVLFHGFGFGFVPYLRYIFKLKKHTNLIIPVLPNISNMVWYNSYSLITKGKLFPSYQTFRKFLLHLSKHHQINKFNTIAHSFGTIILGIILNCPKVDKIINKRVLLEPACFIDRNYKAYNYMENPSETRSLFSKIVNYLIYNDIYVNYVIRRYLFGPEYWLYCDDIKKDRTLIIVSDCDKLIPSNYIYKKYSEKGVKCVLNQCSNHADMLFNQDETLKEIQTFLFSKQTNH